MTALGLNQAYMLLKLGNNYYIFSVNMFIWIDNRKNIIAINKKFIHFFFNWISIRKIIIILNVHYQIKHCILLRHKIRHKIVNLPNYIQLI